MWASGSGDDQSAGSQPSWVLAVAGIAAFVTGARSAHSHPAATAVASAAATPFAGPSISLVIFLSAMFANAITTLITFPLDTIKTLQQSSPPSSPLETGSTPRPSVWRGLFRGILPTLIVGIPCSGLYFMLFDLLRRAWNPQELFLLDLVCACTAQVFAGTLMIPADAVKIQLQAGAQGTMKGASNAVMEETQSQGGLCNPTLRDTLLLTYLRDFTFASVQMLLYTTLHAQTGIVGSLAGSIAAATACLISNPFDAIRTRRMLPSEEEKGGGAAAAPAGASSGYFDGLVPRLALSALAGTIFFNFFEMAKPHVTRVLTGMMSGAH